MGWALISIFKQKGGDFCTDGQWEAPRWHEGRGLSGPCCGGLSPRWLHLGVPRCRTHARDATPVQTLGAACLGLLLWFWLLRL